MIPNGARTIVAVIFGLVFAAGIAYAFAPLHEGLGYCGTTIGAYHDDPGAQSTDSGDRFRHACAIEARDRLVIAVVGAAVGAVGLIITLTVMPPELPDHRRD